MAHYRKAQQLNGLVAALIIIGVILDAYHEYVHFIVGGLAVITSLFLLARLVRMFEFHNHQHVGMEDIDTMDGLDFEQYIAGLLRHYGFTNITLTERYDMGVDIVAEKNDVRWGIQVKRYNGLVKAAAVRQAVTALRFYECNRAMVITNSMYSRTARQLADSNECVLIDRSGLVQLIS